MKTVLLIDDDQAFRSLLTQLLRDGGWNVLEADNGEEGLSVALEQKPNVVVCDLLMPRSNGFQFCRALHAKRSALPDTKIVISSGSGYAIDRINALESGADEYVTKPMRADDLLALLERLTGQPKKGGHGEGEGIFAPKGETRVRFWGVRGSIPSPGPETVYYGGNTSCVEVRADGELIIFDAGTGIRQLGHELKREFGDRPMRMTILVSHTHWDHIQGFPFFAPAYDPKNKVRILAFEGPRKGVEATLSLQMESPYFPISMEEMPGNIQFEELKAMEFDLGSVHVKAAFMNHPGVCVGYRLTTSAGSVCYFPDNELYGKFRKARGAQENGQTEIFARNQDEKLRDFVSGADIVISDAQYDAQEYPQHIGWGHSCADDVVEFAIHSNIKQLYLFHHDPEHTDAHIAQMLAAARKRVSEAGSPMLVEAAREGLEVVLKRSAQP
jgi:phosphoribosyl 1,2-cyclic phosphodiesterase/CheY-like chemotaxis protein